MNVHEKSKKPIRVVETIEDLNQLRPNNVEPPIEPGDELPILYVVLIQVKIWILGWVTIWKKSCDVSDGDTRPAILAEANNIQRLFIGV